MDFQRRVRNFLVGKAKIEPRSEFKSAMLRGYMVLIGLTVGIAYSLVDFSSGVTSSFPYYVADILLSLATLVLNRQRKFHLANLLFLFTFNFLIFLFASSDIYRTGIYMFFLCISISAFALLGRQQIQYAILFSALSLVLFLISYWGKFSIMKPLENNEQYINLYFTINFLVALTTCVLVVYSLISLNHHSESRLLQTTRELRKSRERNEMVVEAVNAGIYEWRLDEKSVFISTTWKRLLGYEEHELTALTIELYFSMLHPDEVEHVNQTMVNHFRERTPYSNELRIKKKSGEYGWFLDNGLTKFTEQGEPLVTVGSIIDINDRKLAEEKILLQNSMLIKTNKELDQFVYSVSHDLRAPLSSIQGLTHVYELSASVQEKASIVKLISDRANTLDAFIREILDYSRNARTEVKMRSINIVPLIEEVVAALQHMSGWDRMRMDIDIPDDLEIVTDRERLKVIVTNMITNAVKYSDPGKSSMIRVQATMLKDGWNLSFQDNGLGIAAEHLDKIFEMFYQGHSHSQGSGLGLYIATEAVQRLGGKIHVISEPGVGSTFTLSLPLWAGPIVQG